MICTHIFFQPLFYFFFPLNIFFSTISISTIYIFQNTKLFFLSLFVFPLCCTKIAKKKEKLILDNARQPILPQLPVYLTLAYARLRISTIRGIQGWLGPHKGVLDFLTIGMLMQYLSPVCNASYI